MDIEQLTIPELSQRHMDEMQAKLDNLAKPVKSLGQLEKIACQLAGIYRTTDIHVKPRVCLVFAADNGVVAEGVSATPKKVTAIQAVNMMNGHTTVAALAKAYDCEVIVTDVGIDTEAELPGVIKQRIRPSTSDMLYEPAMTRDEAIASLQIGFDSATEAIQRGARLVATGELGMANTTAASAMIVALTTGISVSDIVGRGSNISDQRLIHKVDVVKKSLDRAGLTGHTENDPLEVLSQVGAFELGAMAGAMLGTAASQKPIILDGFLSYAALLLAERLAPGVSKFVIPSHKSNEVGSKIILEQLGIEPLINIHMCVGEGSGAMMMLPWLDGIESILTNMNSLQEMDFDFIP